MADALDSKSSGGDLVPVQVRPAALLAGAFSVDEMFTGNFFMYTGVSRNDVSRTDRHLVRRVEEAAFPTRL